TVRGALIAIALLALIAAGVRSFLPEPPLPPVPDPIPEGVRLRVPARVGSATAVCFSHTTPPPWPWGNSFALAPYAGTAGRPDAREWHVANMHFENYVEAVRRWGLKSVEVERIGGCFFVVDPRIPRRWLLEDPCPSCAPDPVRDAP